MTRFNMSETKKYRAEQVAFPLHEKTVEGPLTVDYNVSDNKITNYYISTTLFGNKNIEVKVNPETLQEVKINER